MPLAERHLPRYTVEDFKRWEGEWELIEGIAYALAPSPIGIHQKIVGRLVAQITSRIKACEKPCVVYPDLDWIVNETTVLRPDIMLVCKEILEYLKEPPEVVIEVVSPNTATKDEVLKFSIYEREKVRFYVLVYPDLKKIRVFELFDNRYEKVFDSDSGNFEFPIGNCRFDIDIEELFR